MSPVRKKNPRNSKNKRAARTARRADIRKPLSAEHLYEFSMVTGAAISPDEQRIAYTVETVAEDHKSYINQLHMYNRRDGSSKQFTFGKTADRAMVWSPDGKTIAFISTRDKKSGIYLISADGGAERKLLELDGQFSGLQWFPAGDKILFTFRKNDSFDEKDEKKKKDAPLYRHITRFLFRMDGVGYFPKDPPHIWSVDVSSASARQLSRGKLEHESATLSPDAKKIYFIACDKKDPDRYSSYADIFVMPSAGGKVRKLKSTVGPKYSLAISRDGKTLAYLGHDNVDDAWGVTSTHVWTLPASGGVSKDLIPNFDRHAEDQTIGDTGEVGFGEQITFSPDGKRVYFLASDTGNTHLFYAPTRGGAPTRIMKKPMHVKGFSLNGKCSIAAIVMTDLKHTPELHTVPTSYASDDRLEKLSGANDATCKKISLGKTREIWFTSFDGTRLQGWMTFPPNFNPNRKYPSILNVHGGPRVQYGNSFFHEMNYLAARGYVVFYTNPRGGNGRGETFAEAIVGSWGDLDYKDVMAAADHLEKQPFINKKRMGVTGGSYGGYMTNWLIGHTNRFRAAVTQRCVSDLSSFVASSDIGFELCREFEGQPWENAENYKQCSPVTHIGKHVKTPLLIIHSENDLRCDKEQAMQMFVKLKWLGKKVEMVWFPEEPHGLSRHGRPDRRVARLEWLTKWFDKYLK